MILSPVSAGLLIRNDYQQGDRCALSPPGTAPAEGDEVNPELAERERVSEVRNKIAPPMNLTLIPYT